MNMLKSFPKISVIMSVYNGSPDYLRESVDSILQQSFTDFEFIIIDDCSSDDSWSILSEYALSDRRILLLRNQQNMGLTKSLNKALNLARGEYIARQDADDISMPTRFDKQVTWLTEHAETVLVSSEIQRIRPDGTFGQVTERACPSELLSWHLLFHNQLGGHSQVMFRRQPVVDIGGYNEAYRYSQDYELWCRLAAVGNLAVLPEALLHQRFHAGSISARKQSAQSKLVCEQVARNLEPLMSKVLLLSEAETLHRFWSVDKLAKADRFPQTELAAHLSQQLSTIYRAYTTQQSVQTKQAIRGLIGQKFLAWASTLNRRTKLWIKIQIYLIALQWSPQLALEQWPVVFSKTKIRSQSGLPTSTAQQNTTEMPHSAKAL
ncbi:MAG: glycosyltransferase [Cyanobacteria bacterium P01_F01_bin.86]